MARRPKGNWKVPRMWNDGECFILGGGDSLRGFDFNRIKGRRIIAINNAYKHVLWADIMFFADTRWPQVHGQQLSAFGGIIVTTSRAHVDRASFKSITKQNAPAGISTDPSVLRWNLSSGGCAVGLAVHLGVKRIVLLGYDMRLVEGRNNFHDDYAPRHPTKQHNPYRRFLRPFPKIAEDLKKMRVECINACPGSALDVFPIVSQDEVLPPRRLSC